jgi:hypothetical protein
MNTRTTDLAFSQSASPEEKAAILQNEKRLNTRAAMQAVLDPSLSGRFAKEAKADFTVGRDPVVNYPRLPAGNPWSQLQPPDEPALGIDIQYVEPCGTLEEIERSLTAGVFSSLGTEAGSSLPPPATTASPEASPGSADLAASPPSATSSPPLDVAAARPVTPPFSLGSDPPFTPDQQLATPPTDAASAHSEGANRAEHVRGGAALSSRGSMTRRFG